ncbi:two-component system sensor histidine kinase VanS [Microbacterium phyllosphaerae]|uniref:histidine kinase n=1 Tax=Microbacterium phyllosphaerae TaxID=124798 RepID=A0ABS4WL23_9MICO|nr:HAMP domain-containing sensor histidine kinase [Microbacterium phyllosphaerae]MBP2376900.1 two-component system sensor histidine kinase VanS [Microbacterium phyllosphaerae]
MSDDDRISTSIVRAWRRRFTFRARLTVAFTTLFGIAGITIVLVVTVFMRTIPVYTPAVATRGEVTEAVPLSEVEESLPAGAGSVAVSADGIVLRDPAGILNVSFIVSLVVLTILIAAGAVAAWFIAGRMLRPLQAINHAAQLASTGTLSHRVGLQGPNDELRDLSDTFDMMLGRLDDAFQSHQRFAANASHELRTPLATTQTLLEVALADPEASAAELREVAARVLATNKSNTEIIEALLSLADIGTRSVGEDPVDLGALMNEVVATARDEADAACIEVRVVTRRTVTVGDTALLRQAFMNLVLNAIRHNLPGGYVEVLVTPTASGPTIRVENTGPALASARLDALREPFARGSGRVETERRGHGLGLAIAATAIEHQQGTLTLTPRTAGGVIAFVALPALSRRDSEPDTSTNYTSNMSV